MSKWLKKIVDFYISGSIHVALSVYALVRITLLEFHLPYDESVAYFGFYGTIVGYNFIKYDALARVRKVVWHKQLKAIVVLSFVSAILCGYYFFQLFLETQLTAMGALLLTGFYTLPIVPKKSNFRNWSGVKIYLVALSWAIVTVIMPILNSGIAIDYTIWMYALQRFLLVFVLMLVFEIVDLAKDDLSLQTIPQQIGITKTKWLGYGLLLMYLILEFFRNNINFQLLFLLLLVVLSLYFAKPQRSKYYTSFWVEMVPVLWWVIYVFEV